MFGRQAQFRSSEGQVGYYDIGRVSNVSGNLLRPINSRWRVINIIQEIDSTKILLIDSIEFTQNIGISQCCHPLTQSRGP